MQTYLLIRDFRRRRNKMGLEYGMPVSIFATPEALWGYDHVSSAYHVAPIESRKAIEKQLTKYAPKADAAAVKVLLG